MKTFTILLCALATLVTGCAQLRSHDDYWIKSGQAQPRNKAAALLYYANYVRGLSGSEYAQELDRARALQASEKTDFRLLQYALALSVPAGDTRRAQQLIEPLLKENSSVDPDLGAFAQMLNAELAERRRLEVAVRRAEAGADVRGKRADELEKKVEAIKNIEKNMIERDKSSIEKP